MFTLDYSNTKEFADFKAKDYEMIVADAYEETNANGNTAFVIDWVVRNDIQQEKQNAHIWDRQYRGRDGKYYKDILFGKAKSMGLPEGKAYRDAQELADDMKGKTAKVRIKLEEYNGNTRPVVHYTNPSDFPNSAHQWKEKSNTQTNMATDDLPF